MIAFSTMALLIELRRPGNRVARVMAAAGALLVITFLGFAVGAIDTPACLPTTSWAARSR